MKSKERIKKESDERYTPEEVLDIVRAVDKIKLDPCTTVDNRTKAEIFYTFEDKGETKDWYELTQGALIYINPPFSNLKGWLKKIIEEYNKGCEIILLGPGDCSTQWFQKSLWETSQGICFYEGRIKFIKDGQAMKNVAMQPTVFGYWGKRPELFRKVFENYGRVITRIGDNTWNM